MHHGYIFMYVMDICVEKNIFVIYILKFSLVQYLKQLRIKAQI